MQVYIRCSMQVQTRNKALAPYELPKKKKKKNLIAATETSEVQQRILVSLWTINPHQQPGHMAMQVKY